MKSNKKIFIVAHGNSLRALCKIIFDMSDNEIINFNIPTGVPMEIKFNKYMNPLSKVYLGDEKEIANKIEAVKNQTSLTK